jgi:DNA-binding transcriptional LysR family regulator
MQLPAAYVAPELAAGRLVTILADWDQPQLDSFFLYYPSRRQMRPPLKALVDFLREAYRGAPAGRKATSPFPE